jgi:5-methylthioadenosine/S-adenosylhomocysteine deaminase
LKLKSGVAPILEYRENGVNLALGCDNCSASDIQNLFQAMKLYCMLSTISTPGRSSATAATAFEAATVGGAKTALLGDTLGALRPGFKADIVLLDLADPAYVPFNSAVRQLVYSDTGRSVRTVIVDGRVVVRQGAMATASEEALRDDLSKVMPAVLRDFERWQGDFVKLRPYLDEIQRRAWADKLPLNRFVGAPRF